MTLSKLIFLLIILSLFSCNTDKKEIISKWDNNTIKLERIYSDTPNTYIERKYYENGQLASITRFVNSIENGEYIAYYKDGNLLAKCVYKNGKINGEVYEFHKNGNPMFKGTQVDGEIIKGTRYYNNGQAKSEYYYHDDKAFLISFWYSSGFQQIKNGEGVRKYNDFLNRDKNGNDTIINVFVVGAYKDSVLNGHCKYYSALDSSIVLEREYVDDKIVTEKWY